MKKTLPIFVMICYAVSCVSQERFSYTHPIPFSPETYVCYRSSQALTIDGKADEPDWQQTAWTHEFVDIEGALKPKPALDTKAKMLWDESYLYIYAQLNEPHIWGTLTQRDTIIYFDDDFEVFIDPDGDSHHYYELEINARNTLWDLFMFYPYRLKIDPNYLFNWCIPDIKTAVHIEGTLNNPNDIDEYWSVEMAIPWSALSEMAHEGRKPVDGEQWRINFSRVDWKMEIGEKGYRKVLGPDGKPLPESNWVWSPTGRINMHMPEMWGFVQFSDIPAGNREVEFKQNPDESVKWALWNLYFQQKEYFKKYGKYSDDLSRFTIPDIQECPFQPKIYITPTLFEILAPSCEGTGEWHIRMDGRVEKL